MWLAPAEEQDGDEIDFAVLRMTLGIPGFDEKQLPTVVAALCVLLILANRQFSHSLVTQAQVRLTGVKQIDCDCRPSGSLNLHSHNAYAVKLLHLFSSPACALHQPRSWRAL